MDVSAKYRWYKYTIFAAMYIGYVLYMLDRKAFSFATPAVMNETGMGKSELGLIASSQNIAYTISKLLGGILSDHISPRFLFSSCLVMSGLVVIVFPMFESVYMFAILWFLEGFVQGGGWPACAKILRQWFTSHEIGFWWGISITANNLACSVGPIVATMAIFAWGWRAFMQWSGFLSIIMAALSLMLLVDSPEDVGITGIQTMASKNTDKGKRRGRGTWQDLLSSQLMWTLCLGYMVVFCIRTALLDWAQLYLIQECHHSPYTASMFVSSLETGGIIGSVVAGFLGDKAVAMTRREDTKGTPRMWVLMSYIFSILIFLHLLLNAVSEESSQTWILCIGFCLGFGVYGPIALYGVMAMESAPGHLAGTSQSFCSFAANVGGVCAGLPFSFIAKYYDWSGAFLFLETLLFGILVMKVLSRNMEYKMIPIRKKLE